MMNDEQLLQYSRQIMLPEVDIEGQDKLLAAKVLVIGLGGLGCPVAMYLAAAGVGHLTLVDYDEVDLTNLQRQIAHTLKDVGRAKVHSAKQTLLAINPSINVVSIAKKLEGEQLEAQIADCDLVLDCTDNFSTRYAINAACVRQQKPLVSGAAIRLEGQLAVFDARDVQSPCYQCLYPEGSEQQLSCSENGVIAPLTGIIGTMQALQTIKLIIGFGETLVGHLLLFDAKSMNFQRLRLNKNLNCPVCQ
ncbi:MAG: molybdopterin-synthase adenylyltransferase MoeB [Pseudomonadales bacterium]|nr:molybdopterin-synthase adenylyltransferase MoeB [Pseudomonadales bacterium]MCP5215497.1 molybdopterin-synthase adenylyltransferase MoeB [Pseudomonadales bacterium]